MADLRRRLQRIEPTGSQIYLECLPLFARATVQLSGHPTLQRELRQLERRAHRNGKDVVDHPGGCHDDHARACCGALWMAIAAAPGLWSRDNLLVGGAPVPVPKYADTIFAVAGAVRKVSSPSRTSRLAVTTIRRSRCSTSRSVTCGPSSCWPSVPGSSMWTRGSHHWRDGDLPRHRLRRDRPARLDPAAVPTIDQVLGDELLATSVAAHVGARRVQVCGSAMTKDFVDLPERRACGEGRWPRAGRSSRHSRRFRPGPRLAA